jgi:hypothetical protein
MFADRAYNSVQSNQVVVMGVIMAEPWGIHERKNPGLTAAKASRLIAATIDISDAEKRLALEERIAAELIAAYQGGIAEGHEREFRNDD